MIKSMMLAGAVLCAAPVMAQQTSTATPGNTVPTPVQSTAPAAPSASAPMTAQAAPAAPVASTDPAQPAPTTPTSGSATASAPATSASQVAQVVDKEFASYDKDGNGTLSASEFDAWMVALKQASDPATKATDPAVVKWNQAAFAQADADKSKSVSKAELTGFLSQGQTS